MASSESTGRAERLVWSKTEIKTLINVWGDREILSKLDGTCRNSPVYREIAKRLGEKGYERSVTQIKNKIKNLKKSTGNGLTITIGPDGNAGN